MIIKTTTQFTPDSQEKITADIHNSILTLTVYDVADGISVERCTRDINLEEFFEPYTMYTVYFNETLDGISTPMRIPLGEIPSNLIRDYLRISSIEVAYIYFNENCTDGLIILTLPADNVDVSTHYRSKDEVLSIFPETYQKNYAILTKKRELLANLSCYDSLSGLEPQVDYLTLLVKELILGDDDIKQRILQKYPNLEQFFNVCGNENLILIKPEPCIFSEIYTQKSNIRKLQSAYYEVKNG